MQNPFHKLTLAGILAAFAPIAVQVYDPSVVSPKVGAIVSVAGLLVAGVSSIIHTNKTTQAIADLITGIASKQATGK